jgi:predicted nucleotidyltransferase
MKTVGIIAEYNPFHNGHKYHIEEAKRLTGADRVIVIMSGNFVQRGEPAIMNKWKRAESALNHGADLIIELPSYYALSSAEMFAYGSISLLDSLGVDTVVFGSEYGSIKPFYKLADYLIAIEESHIDKLQALMQDGHPFATARSLLMKKLFDLSKEEETILNSPNNILGVEYVKSIKLLCSSLKADTIQRKGSHYHSTDIEEEIASATAIRQFLIEKTVNHSGLLTEDLDHVKRQVPSKTFEFIQDSTFINGDSLYPQLRYRLMMSKPEDLHTIHDVREGLEHKILNSFGHVATYGALISKCKSKRFTYTRLSRVLMKTLLDIKSTDIGYAKDGIRPDYARILGFTEKGSAYLKHIRKDEKIQLVTNLKNYTESNDHSSKMFQTDILATNIYSEVDPSIKYGQDHYKQPIVVKDYTK